MFDITGHFCFIIFAQGKWKEKCEARLKREIKEDFLKFAYWDPMYDIPVKIFDPLEKDEDYDACDLCLKLVPRFKVKLGSNVGLLRFSHKLIRLEDIERFFLKILTDPEVKKAFFLMLDHNSYLLGMNIPKILKNIKEQQLNAENFFNLTQNEKLAFNIIYEIRKY